MREKSKSQHECSEQFNAQGNCDNSINASIYSSIEIKNIPTLVPVCSKLETERMWKKRLSLLLEAEINLFNSQRLRKIATIITVVSMAFIVFSFYTSPTMAPTLFYCLVTFSIFGFTLYLFCFVLTKSNRENRDNISRLFYVSNHEIEKVDGKYTLINRASYTGITYINIVERSFGKFAKL
ncbi:hypothetical protein [Alteromonas sp. D210916BOD_24]|uniref:hypothetical protein n=1 Tax=Alteromonas sp. D210916BOD_24 TaxID=3157618 RepID=UPI00399C72A0